MFVLLLIGGRGRDEGNEREGKAEKIFEVEYYTISSTQVYVAEYHSTGEMYSGERTACCFVFSHSLHHTHFLLLCPNYWEEFPALSVVVQPCCEYKVQSITKKEQTATVLPDLTKLSV